MKVFDTRTRTLVAPRPPAGQPATLYVCGITPYDASHLGHAFTYLTFDVLVRLLEQRGRTVRYVRNVTDVDDDILRKARELDVDFRDLARREVARFERDLDGLGMRAPDASPRATEAVPGIVDAVVRLVDARAAYALRDGRVYFDVQRAAERFGRLSRLDRAEMLRQFAEKGGDPEAPDKRDALDFLLWQPSAAGEPAWESPWGAGRPGWHIECSVMALSELGPRIDFHGGGNDLVFPHHEAEIVQSEALTGEQPFVRAWLHVGMVGLDGVKMSKSLGNLVFVGDLLERYEGGAVRRYLLQHHYRTSWSYREDELAEAAGAFKRWRDAAGRDGRSEEATRRFFAALEDDLDTPGALAAVDAAADEGAGESVRELGAILGFDLGD